MAPPNRPRRPTAVARAALIALLVAAAMPAAPPVHAATSTEYYEDAVQRFAARDFEGALLQLKNALQADPTDITARFLAGRTYLRLGDGASAEKELRRARAGGADPNLIAVPLATAFMMQGKFASVITEVQTVRVSRGSRAPVHLLRGRAFMALEKLDEAEQEFVAAARLAPADARAPVGRASVALRQGRMDDALALVEKAATLDPRSANAWYLKAEILHLKGDAAGAVEFYGQAISLQENLIAARIGRAATLVELGRDREALADVEFVRGKLPQDPQATYLYSLILARTGDAKRSEEVVSEAAAALSAMDPEFLARHAPSLFLHGVIAFRQGRFEEAATHLQRFLSLRPRHPGARKLLGTILLRRGEAISAVDVLEPLVLQSPGDAEALALLGQAYTRANRPDRAQALLDRALALSPDRKDLAQQLAVTRRAAGNRSDAKAILQQTLEADPTDHRSAMLLAELHFELGEYEETIRIAADLFKLRPDDPQVFNLAGRAKVKIGHLEGAKVAFEEAVRLAPNYLPAKLNLASLALRRGRFQEAEARYRQVVAASPQEARALAGLARVADLDGRRDEAIGWLEKLRANDKRAVSQLLRLAEIYVEQGDPVRAQEVVTDLETAQPENLDVLVARARIELADDRAKQARTTLRRVVRLAGYQVERLLSVAKLQEKADDVDGAYWTLRKAATARPEFVPAQQALIALEMRLGKLDEALSHALALREAMPRSPAGDVLVGDALMRLDRHEDAIAAYQTAAGKADSPAVTVRLFEARRAAGREEEALATLEAWRDAHPEDDQARRLLANGYLRAGLYARARTEIEGLLERRPADPGLLNNLAWLYLRDGDPRAAEVSERAYRLAPEDAAVLDTFGWVLVESGSVERGLKLLREAYVRASEEPTVRYHLGAALARLGRDAEARAHLQAAVRAPGSFAGREQAESLLARLGGE